MEGLLHSIHFKRPDKKGERKQMTVTLPGDEVDRLRRRAREEGLTAAEYIEGIIRQGSSL